MCSIDFAVTRIGVYMAISDTVMGTKQEKEKKENKIKEQREFTKRTRI